MEPLPLLRVKAPPVAPDENVENWLRFAVSTVKVVAPLEALTVPILVAVAMLVRLTDVSLPTAIMPVPLSAVKVVRLESTVSLTVKVADAPPLAVVMPLSAVMEARLTVASVPASMTPLEPAVKDVKLVRLESSTV